jgi:hypothetical protein
MEHPVEAHTELLCGRLFTHQELQEIQDTLRLFPKLSQTELAKTICEMLSWFAPNGKHKLESCRELLKKLESREWLSLPEKRHTRRPRKEQPVEHSQIEPELEIQGMVTDVGLIELQPVRSQQDIRLWNAYIDRYHQLGYKRPFGAHQRYFIWSAAPKRRRLGCMLFSASAWALAERDAWIGWNKEERSQQLQLIVNNTRFLIFPWVKVKNLASKALSLASKRIRHDWQERYGFEPILLETFVDGEHYKGTCYQAANWIKIGLTAGRGRMDRHTKHLSSPKQIYMYPLRPDFRVCLLGDARKNRHF